MTRRATSEPMLPIDFAQPRKSGKREPDQVYDAIVHLRRVGRQVYRCGSRHKVDGKLAEQPQMLALAASLGWRP